MKKVGIIPNASRDLELVTTKELVKFLVEKDCKCIMEKQLAIKYNVENVILSDDIFTDSDFIVSLGGDGTILQVAKLAAFNQIPIIGINLGNLGYLTDVEKNDTNLALTKVLEGNYKKETRMMVEASINKGNNEITELGLALNDVCITRSYKSKLIEVKIYINDEYIDTLRADGVIVSTPTGSTAYNLSANGPILKPDSQMIAITPVCPHNLYARPFVVSSDDIVTIVMGEGERGHAIISMDGGESIEVAENQKIIVKKSENRTTILKTNGLGFYEILRLKMVGDTGK